MRHTQLAEETRARLEAAGFVGIEVWTEDEPTAIEPGEPLDAYLRTACGGGSSGCRPGHGTLGSCRQPTGCVACTIGLDSGRAEMYKSHLT